MKFKEYCIIFKEINNNERFKILYKMECFNLLKIELCKEKKVYTDLFINKKDIVKTNFEIFKNNINNKKLFMTLLFDKKISLTINHLLNLVDNKYIYLFDYISYDFCEYTYSYNIRFHIFNRILNYDFEDIELLILKIIEKINYENIKKISDNFNLFTNKQYCDIGSNKNNGTIDYNICITKYEQLRKINLFKTIKFIRNERIIHKKGCLCYLLHLTDKNKFFK